MFILLMSIVLDSPNTSQNIFFRPYQIKILHVLQGSCESLSPKEIWIKVNEDVTDAISRFKIIYFLDNGVEDGIIDFTEDSSNSIRYFLIGSRN